MGDVVDIRDDVAEVSVDRVLDGVKAANYKSIVLVGLRDDDVPVLHGSTGDFGELLLMLTMGRCRIEDAMKNG